MKKSNQTFTDLVFILDRSGSMRGLERDTLAGFNEMIDKQKREPGQALVTTILFDDIRQMLYLRRPLERLRPLDESQYYVRGCTALLDAIGQTIHDMIGCHKAPEHKRKVVMVIITDGLENASREYSYLDVKDLIQCQKSRHGWEFIFLGANMDAVEEAAKIGIQEERAGTYANDSRGLEVTYQAISNAVSRMRMGDTMHGEWKQGIEEDRQRRRDY